VSERQHGVGGRGGSPAVPPVGTISEHDLPSLG
jgi:hypothetical protein